jgi:hypothetical protein
LFSTRRIRPRKNFSPSPGTSNEIVTASPSMRSVLSAIRTPPALASATIAFVQPLESVSTVTGNQSAKRLCSRWSESLVSDGFLPNIALNYPARGGTSSVQSVAAAGERADTPAGRS